MSLESDGTHPHWPTQWRRVASRPVRTTCHPKAAPGADLAGGPGFNRGQTATPPTLPALSRGLDARLKHASGAHDGRLVRSEHS